MNFLTKFTGFSSIILLGCLSTTASTLVETGPKFGILNSPTLETAKPVMCYCSSSESSDSVTPASPRSAEKSKLLETKTFEETKTPELAYFEGIKFISDGNSGYFFTHDEIYNGAYSILELQNLRKHLTDGLAPEEAIKKVKSETIAFHAKPAKAKTPELAYFEDMCKDMNSCHQTYSGYIFINDELYGHDAYTTDQMLTLQRYASLGFPAITAVQFVKAAEAKSLASAPKSKIDYFFD